MRFRLIRLLPLVVAAVACSRPAATAQSSGGAQASPQPASIEGVVRAETYATGLEHPWSLAFMPDGRLLVTERPGRLRIVGTDGKLSAALAGVPEVHARGQGGLLDVALDPKFAENQVIYLSFAGPDGDKAATSVARARLAGDRLEDVRIIYRQKPSLNGNGHFGSRLVFGRDGTLFVTQGDRQASRAFPQDLSMGQGKIVRINADGSIPKDNPFVGRDGALPEIWSYGHRNVQAAALHPETGQLWTVEHGARGGDELNHPEKGKNYGWPVITYGIDYNGSKIGEGTAKEGMEQPVYYWDPVIAPSGMLFYTGDRYPGWKGSVFIGSMTPGALVRLQLDRGRVVKEERYLGDMGERIRDVQQGPDGLIYVVTDSPNGRVLRVVPVAAR